MKFNMGIFGSSEEHIEEKLIDTTGQVNNNIVIQEAKDVHEQLKTNENTFIVLCVMCSIEVIRLGLYLYYKLRKNIKKQYNNNFNLNNQQNQN